MEEKERERMKALIQKVEDAGGDLSVLSREEGREFMTLLRKWVSDEEFGYPISGEE